MVELLRELNINYRDISFYELAMTHPSMHNEIASSKNNQRLEFLGDSVFGLVMTDYLYHTFSQEREGELSKLRASYVCEEALSFFCEKLGISKHILIGRSEKKVHTSVQADAFEAFVGALYLDLGLKAVHDFFAEHIEVLLVENSFVKEDYKSLLQELVQADKRTIVYKLLKQEGPPHAPTFHIAVYMEDIKLGDGTSTSKKKAEQLAAKSALSKMVSK